MGRPLVCGVGVYEKGEFIGAYTLAGKSVHTKEYELWRGTLRRCYSKESLEKHPTYAGCTVSENFKNFQYFAEWCQSQVGFGVQGFQLDKDILVKGNKVYSETTCVFVPKKINNLLVSSAATRGIHPIGVNFRSRRGYEHFAAQISNNTKIHLGHFATAEAAYLAYKLAKEQIIKQVAEQYKDQIDPRVYTALVNYEVEVTD